MWWKIEAAETYENYLLFYFFVYLLILETNTNLNLKNLFTGEYKQIS